jgi:ABC-type dipeptide/oligopeptide/nickel transport system permease component
VLRYTLARLGQAVLVLWVVATVVFLLSRASGNVADLMVPQDAPAETQALIEKNLGLDRPLREQYVRYLKDLAHGDFGQSFAYRTDVRSLIADALPNTVELAVCAFGFAALFGIAIGVRSATHPGGWTDNIGKGLALAGQSVPSFFLGILLVLFFSVKLDWLPPFGQGGWQHLVLPAIALGAYAAAHRSASHPFGGHRGAAQGSHVVRAGQGGVGAAPRRAHVAQRVVADRHAGRNPARQSDLGRGDRRDHFRLARCRTVGDPGDQLS